MQPDEALLRPEPSQQLLEEKLNSVVDKSYKLPVFFSIFVFFQQVPQAHDPLPQLNTISDSIIDEKI